MCTDALRQHYEALWPRLLQGLPHDQGVSLPLFISVLEGYRTARLKLMIVGQETNTWYNLLGADLGEDPVGAIQGYYRHFNLGEHYRATPFWQAAHRLAALLSPDVPPYGFVWSNVYLCDQGGGRPQGDIARRLLNLRSLPQEVQILRPDALVFFTGPNYDDALCDLFPGAAYCPREGLGARLLSRVTHNDLPERAFRTYHPNHLQQSGQLQVIETIARLVRET